jgi:hypothetical protein
MALGFGPLGVSKAHLRATARRGGLAGCLVALGLTCCRLGTDPEPSLGLLLQGEMWGPRVAVGSPASEGRSVQPRA